uniref:SAM domain-containing protein n=1 Tax=Tetradesmus obliquus TaxID=3088 RepID=A0A383WHZ4_TETOB|eukprot:jgi/Sobl393_1/17379/SZX76832.1
MADLPRVLLENYLMLAAALENQNLGRVQDMLQYQQKVHQNLLDVVQHIEDAPAVAMTTSSRPPTQANLQEQQQQGSPPPFDDGSDGLQHAADYNTSDQQQDQQQQLQQQQPQQQQLPPFATQQQDNVPLAPWPIQQQHQQQQQQQPAWLSNINQPVGQLLAGLGLQEFEPLLQQQAVDLAALQLMEERHLAQLGLPIGAVVKIKAALAAMR